MMKITIRNRPRFDIAPEPVIVFVAVVTIVDVDATTVVVVVGVLLHVAPTGQVNVPVTVPVIVV